MKVVSLHSMWTLIFRARSPSIWFFIKADDFHNDECSEDDAQPKRDAAPTKQRRDDDGNPMIVCHRRHLEAQARMNQQARQVAG
jgi:hypothetical protein